MNNQYQAPQYRNPPQDSRQPPANYQQFSQAPVQQQGARGSYQQNIANTSNAYSSPASQSGHNNQSSQVNQQTFDKYANSQNSAYRQGPQNQGGIYFPPPQPIGLISPPQLIQQPRDSNSQLAKNSNIQNSKSNQNQVRDILWGEQQHNNTFWEQKFFMIYEKFEWFGERFQIIKGEYFTLTEELQTVDSEQDWNQLKQHHQQFAQRLQEMFQQLIAVADQNQQLINQRLGEEGQGVWQRRYHQLLSNFKALQEQNAQLQTDSQTIRAKLTGQDQSQNYPQLLTHYRTLQEQYDKLFNAYNKLQEENEHIRKNPQMNGSMGPSVQDFQNMRNEYQRTLQNIQSQNQQIKNECQALYEQNENFKHQLHSHGQMSQQRDHLLYVIQQKQSLLLGMNRQLNQFKAKCQQLEYHQTQILSKEQQKSQLILKQQEKQIQNLKNLIHQKDLQIQTFSKKLNDEAKHKQRLISQHQDQLHKSIKSESEKYLRQKQAVQKQLKSLQQEYDSLYKQKNQKDTSKYVIESLQKKIKISKDENQHLIEQIKGKNQQLIALRNVSLQLSSYENILQQYKSMQKEKLNLEQTSRRQHNELIGLKKRLTQVQHELTEQTNLYSSLNSKSSTSQARQLQQEILNQKQNLSKVTSELHKFKQLVDSKQTYINQLEDENSKTLIKLQHHLKVNQAQKIEHKNHLTTLERKIQTLQKRNKSNQTDFKKQMTQNYQKQIKQLRLSNQQKLKKIKKIQQELHQTKSKSTHLQKHSTSYHKQHDLLRKKIQSLDTQNRQLLSKLQLLKSSAQLSQQHISQTKQRQQTLRTQLNSFSIQIQQADNLIKSKNNIIVEYQKQTNQFMEKISALQSRIDNQKKERNQKIKRYEQEISKLKDKLYSTNSDDKLEQNSYLNNRYTSTYSSNRYISFGTKQPLANQHKNEEIFKLENNIIEQMNQQNTKLRNQLLEANKKLNQLQSLSRVVANMEQSKRSEQSKSKISQVPQRDVGSGEIQQRLLRFNQRLQNCIQDNQYVGAQQGNLTASQRIAYHQRQRRQLQITYEKQIKTLKDQIKQLQDQLTTLTTQASQKQINLTKQKQVSDSDIKQFDKYQIMQQQTQKTIQQQVQFLRSKLNQQSKTNSNLIKLNEQLKKQLQEYLQSNKFSTTEYYKMQWKETEKSLFEEKQKLKKLTEENRRLKHQNVEHDTKLAKQYQVKIFNLEVRLKQIERDNIYLTMTKTKGQNQRANLLHDVHVYSADIQSVKSTMETRISQYEKVSFQLRDKCTQLENQVLELNQKLQRQNHTLTLTHSPRFGIQNNVNHKIAV